MELTDLKLSLHVATPSCSHSHYITISMFHGFPQFLENGVWIANLLINISNMYELKKIIVAI